MSSSSLTNRSASNVSGPTETRQLLQSHLHTSDQHISCSQCLPKLKSVCMFSKSVYLILTWTLIVRIIYAVMLLVAAGFIANSITAASTTFNDSNPFISPFCITRAVLAFTAMLYPLSGFLADVWGGQFKTVMIGLACLLFSTVVSITVLLWFNKEYSSHLIVPFLEAAPFYITSICLLPFILVGLAAYYANIMQLGLDQLMEESSMHLSLFIHWAMWIEVLGIAVVAVSFGYTACFNSNNYHTNIATAKMSAPLLILFSFPFILVFSRLKRHWFIAHPAQHNPYKSVTKVLNFVRTHKLPLRRSAFTYCDDEKPSRIDFAKERYGGPFTTEQIEDVKTFLRILEFLLTLGPLFFMDIPSWLIGFTIFGLHTAQAFMRTS